MGKTDIPGKDGDLDLATTFAKLRELQKALDRPFGIHIRDDGVWLWTPGEIDEQWFEERSIRELLEAMRESEREYCLGLTKRIVELERRLSHGPMDWWEQDLASYRDQIAETEATIGTLEQCLAECDPENRKGEND